MGKDAANHYSSAHSGILVRKMANYQLFHRVVEPHAKQALCGRSQENTSGLLNRLSNYYIKHLDVLLAEKKTGDVCDSSEDKTLNY